MVEDTADCDKYIVHRVDNKNFTKITEQEYDAYIFINNDYPLSR